MYQPLIFRASFAQVKARFIAFSVALFIWQSAYSQQCITSVEVGPDITICSGASTQLNAVISPVGAANVTYSWSPATGLSNANIANPTITTPLVGSTKYVLTVTQPTVPACPAIEDFVVVTVNQTPTVNYTFVDNQCSSVGIAFTPSVTGDGSYLYSWNFGDGTTSNIQTPTHVFNANAGDLVQLFNVILTVKNIATNCQNTKTNSIKVKQSPDSTLNSDKVRDLFNNLPVLKECNTGKPEFIFLNASKTKTTNKNYKIVWGDGSEDFTSTAWSSTNHTYQIGLFNMVYSIEGQNGCTKSIPYIIFLGSNPAVSLGNPGNTDICISSALTFPISGTEKNPPGTTYIVKFNDGSEEQIFNHPPPSEITHNFLKTSCGTESSDGNKKYQNSFFANIVATNPCGSSAVGVVPIYVSTPPITDFVLPNSSICTNKSIQFKNNSQGAFEINSGLCNSLSKLIWKIAPNSSYTLASGEMGDDYGFSNSNMWSTGSNTISTSFQQAGNYTISLTAANKCGIIKKEKILCVEPSLVASFTLDKITGCSPLDVTGTNTTDISKMCSTISYKWEVTYAANGCSSTSSYSFINGTSLSSKNPSFRFTNSGTYTIKLTIINSCGEFVSSSQIVKVNAPPSAQINSISNICKSTATIQVTPSATVSNCGTQALTYQWSFPNGTPASSGSLSPGTINYTDNGNYNLSLKVTNECGATDASGSFKINPTPDVNMVANQEKCAGQLSDAVGFSGSIAGTVFNWTSSLSTIGLAASGVGNIPAFILLNNGNSIKTSTITVTPKFTTSGCSGNTGTFTIKVNPQPTVNDISSITICNNGNQSAIAFSSSIIGTTFSWTNNKPSIGLAASNNGNIPVFTATNTETTSVTATISVTPSNSLGCLGAIKTFTITVNPTPSTLGMVDKEFCNGINTSVIAFNNSVAGTTYTWINSKPTIGLAASGIGAIPSFPASNSSSSPVIASIRVTPTYTNSGKSCPGTTETMNITIIPSATVTFNVAPQTICSGESTKVVALNSTTIGVAFNWTAASVVGVTGISTSGTNSIPIQTLTNSTNIPLDVIYKATASLSGGVSCSGTEFQYKITVKPKPYISGTLPDTICSAQNFSVIPVNGNGNIIPAGTGYTWSSPLISTSGAITGSSAQGSVQSSISQRLTNTIFTAATAMYSVTPTASECIGLPFEVKITVNPKPTVAQVSDVVICSELLKDKIDFSGDVSGTLFNWASSSTNIGISNSGVDFINPFMTINTGIAPLIATITVRPSANSCAGTDMLFKITVNPKPRVNTIADMAVCNGFSNSSVSISSQVSGTTFAWTNNNTSIGLIASGSGNVPSFPAINLGVNPVISAISIIPTANNCQGTVGNFNITVNPTPSLVQPLNMEICNGLSTNNIQFVSLPANTEFNWVNDMPSIGLPASGSGNISSFKARNTGATPVIATITVTPTASSCAGVSKTFTIKVNPSPLITNTLVQTICSGDKTNIVSLASNIGGTSFAWSVSPLPSSEITGYQTSGTSTIEPQTLINTSMIPQNVVYHILVSSNLSCNGVPADYVVTVNPLPIATAFPVNQEICSGDESRINLTSTLTNTNFQWQIASNSTNITGATTENDAIILQKLTNTTTTASGVVKYQIIPNVGTCIGNSIFSNITVNPRPKPIIVGETSICDGRSNVVYSTESAQSNYSWTISTGGNITNGQGTNSILVSWTKTGNQTVGVNYFNSFSCNASPSAVTNLVVYPNLPVSISISEDKNNICPGTAVSFTATPTNGGLNPTYQWKVNGINVGLNNAVYNYIPKNGDKVDCQLLSNAICPTENPSMSNTIAMVVYSNLPAQVSIVESANTVCPGEEVTFTATPFNEGFIPVYQWFVNGLKLGVNSPIFKYNPVNGDLLTCELTSSNVCSSSRVVLSNKIKMIVAPPPLQPSFVLEKLNDCTPINVRLRNTSPKGGSAYVWDYGDGSTYTSDNVIDVKHTFDNFTLSTIEFSIGLKVITTSTHCFNVQTQKIKVDPELFAGSPVSYLECSPLVQKFENARDGAKFYKWVSDQNKVLSTELRPTFTFTTTGRRDSTYIIYLIAESLKGCKDTIVNTIKVSPALEIPSFTYSGGVGCKSITYKFKNTSPERIGLFIWDFGDGTINKTFSTFEEISHTFFNGLDTAVSFNVKLTSSSGQFCALSVNQEIVIGSEFSAGFAVSYEGCTPLTRTFTNAYKGSKSIQWKSANGKLLSKEQNPTLTFTAALGRDSIYSVLLIAESMDGCIDTVENKIIVRAANKSGFLANPSIGCAPLNVAFSNSTSVQSKKFLWKFSDGSDNSILENPQHIFIQPQGADAIYTVSLIAYSSYGCADTTLAKIHVLPTPQVDFAASPSEQIYPARTIQLKNMTPTGNWQFTWNFGDQKVSFVGDATKYTYDLPGEYIVSLTAKGTQCETVKHSKIIINPGAPLASFAPDTSGCAPLKVNFRNFSKNGSLFQWNFGNGNQSVDFSPTITYFDEGNFDVTLKVYNQFGVMSTAKRTIVVHPVPKSLFKAMPNRIKIPEQTVTFFNYSVNVATYLWVFGDGSISTDEEPIHRYTQTGWFDVTLFVTSSKNCKDTFQLHQAVDVFSDEIKVPNAFTPDKEGGTDGHYTQGNNRNNIFYPAVAIGDLSEFELLIFNRWGNLLFSTNDAEIGWNGFYNGNLCPQGVYIWKIRCKFKSGAVVVKTGDLTLIQK